MHNKYILAIIALLALVVCSCKDNKDKDDEVVYYSTSTTDALVTSFRLKNDTKNSTKLDSVHFTIDPVRGKIYNVDSLPVGTDVSHLLPTLSFSRLKITGTSRSMIFPMFFSPFCLFSKDIDQIPQHAAER